jgi:hypothetical protein
MKEKLEQIKAEALRQPWPPGFIIDAETPYGYLKSARIPQICASQARIFERLITFTYMRTVCQTMFTFFCPWSR